MNSLVALHRQQYPDDNRSDDQITSAYAAMDPNTFAQVPDAVADYARIQNDAAAANQPGVADYLKQAAGSLERGATEVIADLPKWSATVASKLPLPVVQWGSPEGVKFGLTNQRDESGRLVFDPEDSLTGKLARGIQSAGEKLSPDPVESLKDSFWATKLPNTLGSMAAFVAAGGLGRALTKGAVESVVDAVAKDAASELTTGGMEKAAAETTAKAFANDVVQRHLAVQAAEALPTAVLGASTQAQSAYDEALAKTGDSDKAWQAALLNLPVGAAMALPAHRLLPAGVEKAALPARVAADTAVGTGTMAAQQLASNLIAKETYDPERNLTAGLGETAGAGGIVTAALSALSHGLLGRKSAAATEGSKPAATGTETTPASEVAADAGVNPAENYQMDPGTKARITEVVSRELAGEQGVPMETALAAIYADPTLHAYYALEKSRLRASEGASEPSAPAGPSAPALGNVGAAMAEELASRPTAPAEASPAAGAQPASDVSPAEGLHTPPRASGAQASPIAAPAPSIPAALQKARRAVVGEDIRFSDRGEDTGLTLLGMPKAFFREYVLRSQPLATRVRLARSLGIESESPAAIAKQAAERFAQMEADHTVDHTFTPAANTPVEPPPYWLTPDSYVAMQDGLVDPATARLWHRKQVELAIARRQYVPQEVLDAYPGLVRDVTARVHAFQQAESDRNARPMAAAEDVRFSDRSGGDAPAWRIPLQDFVTLQSGSMRPDLASRIHRQQTELAIARGQPVPANVLASYPGLVEQVQARLRATQARQTNADRLQAARRQAVEAAVERGEDVSEGVLRTYGLENRARQITEARDRERLAEDQQQQRNAWKALQSTSPEALIGQVDFERARVVHGESGLGRKAAAAFTETSDPEQLYTDVTANKDDRKLSRKLGVFESADGSHVMVGTAYENGGQRYVTGFDAQGKPTAVRFDKLKERGYKLVAALKTKEPTRDNVATYSRAQWRSVGETLASRAGEQLGGLEPVPDAVAHEVIGGGEDQMQGGSIVDSPNTALHEWRRASDALPQKLRQKLVEAIGEPEWKSEAEAHDRIAEAFESLPAEDQLAMLEAFSPRDARSSEVDYVEGYQRLKSAFYEKITEGKRLPEGGPKPAPAPESGESRAKAGAPGASEVSRSTKAGRTGSADAGGAGAGAPEGRRGQGTEARANAHPEAQREAARSGDVISFFEAAGINRKDANNWRLTARTRGEISGVPNSAGELRATNGVLCLIERPDGSYFEGHIKWFKPSKPGESILLSDGTPVEAMHLSPKAREIAAAGAEVEANPTEAQKESGNYRKGHVSLDGLDITIENPKGSLRSGTDAQGRPWNVEMPATYGYVRGTEGKDGDHVDVYVGEHPDSGRVWVVDQIDPQTTRFDEHKALLGFTSADEALATYLKAFSDGSGPVRIGAVSEMSMAEFKDWLRTGDTRQPLAYDADTAALLRLSQRGGPGAEYRASDSDLRARWEATQDAARANGVSLSVVRGLREGGQYSARAIALTVSDPLNPTHDNLVLLVHEIGHDLFANLPEAQKAALHRAIAKLEKPEAFNIKIAEAVPAGQRARVAAEESLVERAARSLVSEGFNPAESRGMAQGILRTLKDLYLRSAMAIQRGLLGNEHISPELAQRYFENRLRAFLAGDPAPMSFLSFIGGPRLTQDQRADTFAPAGGAGALPGAFNYDTGSMELAEASGDSWEGLSFNRAVANAVRFSDRGEGDERSLAFVHVTDPHVISRDYNSPVKVMVDVAALNALNDAHTAAFEALRQKGLSPEGYTFEAFLRDFTNADGPATEKIKARNEELMRTAQQGKLDWKPVDTTLRPDDLVSEANRLQAADGAYRYLWSLRGHWAERRANEERFLRTAEDRMQRLTARLNQLRQDYTDMDLQLSHARQELAGLHRDFSADLTAGVNAAHKVGVLTQVLEQLDQQAAADPISLAKRYQPYIKALYDKVMSSADGGRTFGEILQHVSKLNIDWQNEPASRIRDTLALLGHTDPIIAKLLQPGMDSKALLSLVTAFGKTNAHVMEWLKISQSDALQDRAALNKILADAMNGAKDAIPQARELARKLPKLAVYADRLLAKLEGLQAEAYAHRDAMQRARTFIDFHHAALPGLQGIMVRLEQALGARTLSWEPNDGAEYWVATTPRATVEQVKANQKALNLSGIERNEGIIRDIRANRAWLDAVPEAKRGADWQALAVMTSKLEQVVGIAQHELGIKQHFINRYLGSMPDKLESTGLSSLRLAAAKLRDYNGKVFTTNAEAERVGTAVDGAKGRAMKALGFDRVGEGTFERLFYRQAKSFAEKNPDIFAQHRDAKAAFEAFLPRLRKFFESNLDTVDRVTRPKAWAALERYYRAVYEAETAVNAKRRNWGSKIQEVMPDGKIIEREPVGITFATSLRRAARSTLRLYQTMRDAGWLGTKEDRPFDAQRVAYEHDKDPAALDERLRKFFSPSIERGFLRPLMLGMEGRSALYGPRRPDGLASVALRENVAKAYAASRGSVVKMTENLFDLESAMQGGSSESRSEFVGKTVKALHDYFMLLHGQFGEWDDAARHGQPTPRRVFMDARVSESMPGEWLEYATFGRYDMHELFNHLASQSAFGRRLESLRRDFRTGLSELSAKADKLTEITNRIIDQNHGVKGKHLDNMIQKAVEAEQENYQSLKQARANMRMVESEQKNMEALMASYGGLAMELRPFQELIGSIAGAAVQGPVSSLVHLGNLTQAFGKLGLGPEALKVVGRSVSSASSEALGSLAQLFHMQIGWNADRNARRVRNGIVDPDALRRFSDARTALLNDPTIATNLATRSMFKLARGVRLAVSSGFGRPEEAAPNKYATVKPHALFTQTAQAIDAGLIDGWTHGFEDMVERAADYFRQHPGDREDPAFRFARSNLGYRQGFLGLGSDARAFDYFRNALARYGIDLETQAREVLRQRERGQNAPAITDAQFRTLASLVQNEVSLESNIVTRPSSFFTNPILRLSSPLIGWSVAKSHDAWENWRNPDMTQTSRSAMKRLAIGLLPYLALVPAGIALGVLRDHMSEAVLGKKANRQDPLTSFKGMLDALGWVGTFGLGGDVLNAWVNRDTQRPFSVDNRVLFISSARAAISAIQNWMEQDGAADYQTVYRPLMQALGGSGAIQYLQAMNHALSLDNAEARVTARINVGNYLRVAGRELGMDVRTSAGGDVISTPMRPLIGRMVLAAYANDNVEFAAAYRQALAQAKAQGESDPAKYVATKFGSYNPLRSVFRTEPSEQEVRRILTTLDDDGRAAVTSALRLFNAYSVQVGARPFEGKVQKASYGVVRPAPSLDQVRQRAYGGGNPRPESLSLDAVRRAAGY